MRNRIRQEAEENPEPFIFSTMFMGMLTGLGIGLGFLIINSLAKKANR